MQLLSQVDLLERVAAVDEESSLRGQCSANAVDRVRSALLMASVEDPDADCEGEVVESLGGFEFEVFCVAAASDQSVIGDEIRSSTVDQRDGFDRSINGQNMPRRPNSFGDRAGGGTRAATDLNHTHAGSQRKCIDNGRQASGKRHARCQEWDCRPFWPFEG